MSDKPIHNEDYENIKHRIDELSHLVYEVASGNFDYKIDIRDNSDELAGLVEVINMMGEELKESTVSRDFMESIYRGVVDILIILSPDHKIERINDAVQGYLDYTPEELIGKDISFIICEDDINSYEHFRTKLNANESVHISELKLKRKDNIYLETSASFSLLFDNQKKNIGTVLIAKDITKSKQTEKELIEAKIKAEKASQAKSNFLANMSHEIRTPLSGVLGFLELLSSTSLDPIQQKYLDLAITSGQTLSVLLKDILDLTKVESGKLNLESISFNLVDSIKSSLSTYQLSAQKKGIKLNVEFDEGFPGFVVSDPSRIKQVITNLVGNAIKFTDNGSVTLQASYKEFEEDQINVEINVIDSGIGIPKELHENIFKSFTQADFSTTRKFGGTGLGLTITKHLVEMMNGTIEIESPPLSFGKSQGTCFKVNLPMPISRDHLKEVVKADIKTNQFDPPINVLVVDDSDVNLFLAENILKKLNARVKGFQNPIEAIEAAKKEEFDIVLMDIQMPEIDGYEATRVLRKNNFTNPIVALSANAYEDDINLCYQAGMDGHISKPFNNSILYSRICTFLKRFND
jgi:PAS domain S-box-containing protein